ncbi:MAG: alpha/beta hydrolase [Candidatus Lokiarchaeota archaeon]|nr:alpha/beta hydrolase [Candidatus Lokiarchaeota archaeon]
MANIAHVNGINISYEIQGSENGEPLILVSGWCLKKEMWIAQIKQLGERFKLITFDNRGCGKSDRPDYHYTLENIADDVAGLMDHLKIEKANIMGYALGAMAMTRFVLKYPDRVKKLVLLNTTSRFPSDDIIKNIMVVNSKAVDFQLSAPEKYFMKSAIMAFHEDFVKELEANPGKKFHDLWTVAEWVKEYSIDPMTPKDVENQGSAMLEMTLYNEIDKINTETLIIAGSHNKIHPKEWMIEMDAKMPNNRLEILQNAGDMTYLSRAPEVNKLVLDFLQ